MKLLFLIASILCDKSPLKEVYFTKTREQYFCNIEFRKMMEIIGFELFVTQSKLTDKNTGIIYSEKWDNPRSLDTLIIDLTNKCSIDDNFTYALCLNVLPIGRKLCIKPFSYHPKEDNYMFIFTNLGGSSNIS